MVIANKSFNNHDNAEITSKSKIINFHKIDQAIINSSVLE